MRLALAAIGVCLAAVIAGAAAAGIFDAASIPMMTLAFAIVLVLGAAPVIFSAATRRSGASRTGDSADADADVYIIADPSLPSPHTDRSSSEPGRER